MQCCQSTSQTPKLLGVQRPKSEIRKNNQYGHMTRHVEYGIIDHRAFLMFFWFWFLRQGTQIIIHVVPPTTWNENIGTSKSFAIGLL